ncbi:helix-turn-helix domain-containing protein [Arenivirga flava]|uniref:HTH araC/xylS-type domain-containing protein n=1 Tax=Arenivirga flava TaxID=1930060 RepID=A0AA37UNT1_9MICO|nr:helix-turn-helix domain-containing protein [Arenivirga flava]GMA29547.1 hypothetical protein GCM10025874_28000 [Arenivirga flava]
MPAASEHRWSVGGDDLESARTFFEQGYNGRDYRLERTDRPFAWRCSSVGDAQLQLRSTTVDGAMSGSFVLTGVVIVAWLTDGTGSMTAGADRVSVGTGLPVVVPVDRSCHFSARDYRESNMLFSSALVDAEAAALENAEPGSLRFALSQPDRATATLWASTAASVGRVLHAPGASPLAIAETKRSAVAALLHAFEHVSTPARAQVGVVRASRIGHAIEFMSARAHEPLTIDRIAEAAGLSVRGVQDAFQRRHGMPPLEYLRLLRLDRVREDLLSPDGGSTVGAVANRWGFTHLGRFAQYYGERFGERPRDTMREARRR